MRLKLTTLGALVLAWAATSFGVALWAVAPLLLAFAGSLVLKRRWGLLSALAAFSPIGVAIALAAVSYWRGSAQLLVSGLPDLELYNVDPETRFQTVSTGCIVTGGELIWQMPHNVTLRALRAIFGPMMGAYDGPFPSRDDIRRVLVTADGVRWDDIRADRVRLQTGNVRLRTGSGARLVDAFATDASAKPRAATWQGRILVLELPSGLVLEATDAVVLAIIDLASGKVIAYFNTQPLSARRLPRQWT